MKEVKVIIWGLGAMGGGMADMLLKKKGVEIVGVAGRGRRRSELQCTIISRLKEETDLML